MTSGDQHRAALAEIAAALARLREEAKEMDETTLAYLISIGQREAEKLASRPPAPPPGAAPAGGGLFGRLFGRRKPAEKPADAADPGKPEE